MKTTQRQSSLISTATNMSVHYSSGKDDWETPDELFQLYNNRYNFYLDAAADRHSHKCARWFGPGGVVEDALQGDWPLEEGNIWLNPPYSRGLQAKFVRKALAEKQRCQPFYTSVVCLLPARTDTKLFHEVIQPYGRVEFLKGRVKFKGAQHGAPFPSMIVVF